MCGAICLFRHRQTKNPMDLMYADSGMCVVWLRVLWGGGKRIKEVQTNVDGMISKPQRLNLAK